MRLDQLVLRNLSQHRVASALTALNVALGVFLVSTILLLRAATAGAFLEPSRGFSLVVGAPGSELQLVLDTIFHRGRSPGLLAYEVFEELARHPSTHLAVPYAVGDVFRGFRVVGTSDAFFDPRFPYPSAARAEDKLERGRPFRFDPAALEQALLDLKRSGDPTSAADQSEVHAIAEAVVGARVAAALDLRVGDRIEPTHGVEGGAAHSEQQLWEVVGILRQSGTPVDDLVLINLDSFLRLDDHRAALVPESGRPAISSVVLFPKPGVHKALLLAELGKRTELQVADVDAEVRGLLSLVGNVEQILFVIAVLVVVVGVVSVSVAIYNGLSARRRELGILRILGARRVTIFGLVVGEAVAVAALGGAVGIALGHVAVWAFAADIEQAAGVRPASLVFLPEELLAYGLVLLASAAGGVLPALKAYRADAAASLPFDT